MLAWTWRSLAGQTSAGKRWCRLLNEPRQQLIIS